MRIIHGSEPFFYSYEMVINLLGNVIILFFNIPTTSNLLARESTAVRCAIT